MPSIFLSAEGVRKEFPGVVALDDVSFRLKRGTVHALMGENGAGKSTLMKILAGIYTPDKGEVSEGRRDPAEITAGRAGKRHCDDPSGTEPDAVHDGC
jgi:ABC-type sugar transport system ATPase subunit